MHDICDRQFVNRLSCISEKYDFESFSIFKSLLSSMTLFPTEREVLSVPLEESSLSNLDNVSSSKLFFLQCNVKMVHTHQHIMVSNVTDIVMNHLHSTCFDDLYMDVFLLQITLGKTL